MRVILSRKGFDSAAGKAPSPIIEGEPISLPIPVNGRSETTYEDVGSGELVEEATKGRISAGHLCHEDPMFSNGRCAFGQTGAAQTHLERSGVAVGDVFLFFGLFASRDGRDRHHRMFGYMKIDEMRRLGSRPRKSDSPEEFSRRHPHTIGAWNENNTLYLGRGAKAKTANPCLRLTRPGGPPSIWAIPTWLKKAGLTYHNDQERWSKDGELRAVSRGQEFVSDIGDETAPREWLRTIQAAIEADRCEL